MVKYTAILISAVAIVLFVTPLVRNAATRFGVTDAPSARKVHTSPVPLLGGLAIWLGFVLTLLLFDPADFVQQFGSIIAGATLASMVGLWDDRWGMKPVVKLVGQMVAAGLMVAFGTSVQFLHNDTLNFAADPALGGRDHQRAEPDGQYGRPGRRRGHVGRVLLLPAGDDERPTAAGAAGAGAGRRMHRLPVLQLPAGTHLHGRHGQPVPRLPAGRGGHQAALPVLYDPISGAPIDHQQVTWMIPLLVLGLPIFDTTLVIISRLRRGLPITRGGRDHTSHRLVALGATRREAVLILYIACCLLGVAAIAVMHLPVTEAQVIGGLVLIVALVGLLAAGAGAADRHESGRSVGRQPARRPDRKGAVMQAPLACICRGAML